MPLLICAAAGGYVAYQSVMWTQNALTRKFSASKAG
jgi:hypothetical protein